MKLLSIQVQMKLEFIMIESACRLAYRYRSRWKSMYIHHVFTVYSSVSTVCVSVCYEQPRDQWVRLKDVAATMTEKARTAKNPS